MLDPLMSLIVAKAKSVGLVAGTAMVTTALVGGGAVAMTAVSSDKPLAEEAAVSESATATATIGVGRQGKGQGAENRSATATAVLTGKDAAETVVFTCDESKNHGQNVSAYARSLPKGQGRGQQVSAAAQSDCGKTGDDTAELEAESAEESKPAKPAKPVKAEPAKPAKPAKADRAAPAKGKPEQPGSHGKGGGRG